MKITILFMVFYILLVGNATAGFLAPSAKLTVHVVDDSGVPVENASVTFGFTRGKGAGEGAGLKNVSISGQTDKEGGVSAENETTPYVTIQIEKEGYYFSRERYEFKSRSLLNRWEPWNPMIEVVLKKKRNPVPMYMKYIEAAAVPVIDSPVGYDLEKGDWVSPHGSGVTSDFIFLCHNKYEDFNNAETSCDITFSNPGDGFKEYRFGENHQSYYKWPFDAPSEGYDIKKLGKWMTVHHPRDQYKSNYKEGINYLFRVRTVLDNDGQAVKGNYGKIIGDFRVYKKAEVNFSYSFNPDGTRNLEEDPKKNLFK